MHVLSRVTYLVLLRHFELAMKLDMLSKVRCCSSQNGECDCKELIRDSSVVIAAGNGLDYFSSISGRDRILLFSIAYIQWLSGGLFLQ